MYCVQLGMAFTSSTCTYSSTTCSTMFTRNTDEKQLETVLAYYFPLLMSIWTACVLPAAYGYIPFLANPKINISWILRSRLG